MFVSKAPAYGSPPYLTQSPAERRVETQHCASETAFPFDRLSSVPCFVAGTPIRVPHGDVLIETLRIGDSVVTRDAGAQVIRWIGKSRVDASGDLAPIAFAPGALGNAELLIVSPDHRMLLTGWRCAMVAGTSEVLAAAKDLVNNRDIKPAAMAQVTYFHLAFDQHQIVTTAGVHSESFHPDAMSPKAMCGDLRTDLVSHFPGVGADPKAYGPTARAQVKPYEARLIRP